MSGVTPDDNSASDDSFSSDSDDEFLTLRGDGKGVDREALVRKKLLESFYGKTGADDHDDGGIGGGLDSDSDDDSSSDGDDDIRMLSSDDEEDGDGFDSNGGSGFSRRRMQRRRRRRSNRSLPAPGGNGDEDDLDSVHFDASKHTERYVLGSSVHPLLETEESLACQVRTLDSSMQTLVYENYSRFIEATDAVRNIGVNVQCNAGNLKKLSSSVKVVGEMARDVETNCGKLRDSVVEKLRTKRLLQRLESLLKLPSTLRESIGDGRYRWATKSYLKAYAILHKQSDGFESLQRIEQECYEIVEGLLEDVKHKLFHWSGNYNNSSGAAGGAENDDSFVYDDDGDEKHADDGGDAAANENGIGASRSASMSMEDPPDPPETVAGIFECAGTPVLILNHQQHQQHQQNGAEPSAASSTATSQIDFVTGVSVEECQEMSLDACLRLIERFLDTHHIELQEALLTSSALDNPGAAPMGGDAPQASPTSDGAASGSGGGSRLIPTNVLDSILEASALYSVTFPTNTGEPSEPLSKFVTTAFYSFLQHVRTALLEQSAQTAFPKDLRRSISRDGGSGILDSSGYGFQDSGRTSSGNMGDDEDGSNHDDDEGPDDSEDRAHEQIANATALLLESVQQFSSALALPEVAIDGGLASSLVEQTLALSEAMVRRRVDQKLFVLRFRVLQNCLAPFCRQAMKNDPAGGKTAQEKIDRVVQMASVALSDASQLIDDTVRSIVSSSTNGSSKNDATLKTAVEQSTARFASWLATALEMLAGCESSESKYVLDVMPEIPEDERAAGNIISPALFRHSKDKTDSELSELVENAMDDLLEELDELEGEASASASASAASDGSSARSYLTLAIAEMCRLAQRTVVDDINQSIAIHTGSINKHRSAQAADGLFATALADGAPGNGDDRNSNNKDPTSMRFRLAASRVLALYAIDRGNEAGEWLSSGLSELSGDEGSEEASTGPREGAWSLLTVAKSTAFDCAGLFGGPKRAGPVPEDLEDEYVSLTMARQNQGIRSTLAIDVERMFAEKVFAFPHPFEDLAFDRNLVVFQVLKVAFLALREDVRLVRFTNQGYRQLLVDTEFLKFMLPHYVKDEELADHSTANPVASLEGILAEATKNAKERCDGSAMLQDDALETNQARAVVRGFMASNGGSDGLVGRFTISEDDETDGGEETNAE
ncbi:unnamed protein product [Pseudo-nitzschia multistriata]|uniref:Uncharacterized protein n=1 Tax=Pseudo-nitzschia multistriata TaxID=183589 RepID=A0A448Z1T3_9STRA|nr:unnamed protein product [Pseudo-nitzschia multistriata]